MSLREVARRVYEPFMALTAVALAVSVAAPYAAHLSAQQNTIVEALSWFAYGVFLIDHVERAFTAKDRRAFFRQHWVETVALLPLGLFGFFTWFRLFRAAIMLRRYSDFFHGVFLRHGFLYIFLVTFGLVFAGAWAISRVEPGLGNFGDALWWSFVTTSTVGYGDIAPKTVDGRLVAVALMLLGIGFLGLFTGSVATFFVERLSRGGKNADPELDHLKERLQTLPDMSEAEYDEFRAVMDTVYRVRHERKANAPSE